MDVVLNSALPDLAEPGAGHDWGAALNWVGMSGIELPVRLPVVFLGKTKLIHLPAKVDFQVNLLERQGRGIHMSRLYRILTESASEQNLDFKLLETLAQQALKTHEGMSSRARIIVRFELPIQRTSLKSSLVGWRSYPVSLTYECPPAQPAAASHVSVNEARRILEVQVLYSSTCPASAALAESLQLRELPGSHFVATPHAQRSWARVSVELKPNSLLDACAVIGLVEGALKTPVQTAVKREDEQEFARLNAQNLMFCEDAARRIQVSLATRSDLARFEGEVRHFESLHPHDAVAVFGSER